MAPVAQRLREQRTPTKGRGVDESEHLIGGGRNSVAVQRAFLPYAIGKAWENYRKSQCVVTDRDRRLHAARHRNSERTYATYALLPHVAKELWALRHDDMWTVHSTIEEALAEAEVQRIEDDRCIVATICPCAIAFPGPNNFDADELIDRISEDSSDVYDWSDFFVQEDATVISTSAARGDLELALASAFKCWAERNGVHRKDGDVRIRAWRFTGPARSINYDGKRWAEGLMSIIARDNDKDES